jgi:hypothetical protein
MRHEATFGDILPRLSAGRRATLAAEVYDPAWEMQMDE